MMSELCARELNLSENDKRKKQKKGTKFTYVDRTDWAVYYLYRATLLQRVRRGIYTISQNGKKLLNKPITASELDKNFLLRNYPEFKIYATPRSVYASENPEQGNIDDENLNVTPHQVIENAFNEISEKVKSDLLQRILGEDPFFFEELVVDLLRAMGYAGADNFASTTSKTGDGGIDGILFQDALGLDTVYIQAKRYTDNSIPKKEIRDFLGALELQNSNKGIFITTSNFSNGAYEAIKTASKTIISIDGDELTRLMLDYDVGIRNEKVFKIPR